MWQRLATGVSALLLGLGNAQAASGTETLSYARFFAASDPRTWYACEQPGGACAGSVLAPDTKWTAHYASHASADFGVMHTYASVQLSGDGSLGP
jgi:hypothetical protein